MSSLYFRETVDSLKFSIIKANKQKIDIKKMATNAISAFSIKKALIADT